MFASLNVDVTVRWLVATLHLLALGIGFGALYARARALRATRFTADLRSVFFADNLWALAGVLWLGTGLWRAFGGLERGTAYYLQNPLFHAKLGVVVLILLLELSPMVTFMSWRRAVRRSATPDLARAPRLARASSVQLVLLIAVLLLATAIARGLSV